ncbi:MAG: tetratricopeptide repeat protein [Pseudomonadota bacterium]
MVFRSACALGILSLTSLPVAASSGAVELAPVAREPAPIEQRDLNSLSGFYLAGRQAGISKDLSSAAGFYSAALQKDPDNPQLLDRALLLNVASGNVTRAAELAGPLLEDDPNDQLARLARGVHAFRAGDREKANADFEAIASLNGPVQQLMGTLLRAWVMADEGRPARASSLLDQLDSRASLGGITPLHAGLIADAAGLFEVSKEKLSVAYNQEPQNLRVMEAYARTLARAGDKEQALKVVGAYQSRSRAVSELIAKLKSDIEAGDVAPLVADARAGMAEALYGLSSLGRQSSIRENTFSAAFLQLALFLTPNAEFPALALGGVFESIEQYQAAIDVYSTIANSSPLAREGQMQAAINLTIMKRHDEAIARLAALVEADETDVGAATTLGNVHRSLEHYDKAAEVYGSVIDQLGTVPQHFWTLLYYRGIANERLGNWKEAEKDFRQALELSPEHPLVLNYLGYSYIDRGENLDEAIAMVRRAVEQRPDDGYIVDSLGWAYYRLGEFEKAVRQLERAATLRPGDPVINDHLGDAYWKVGRKLEATFQWAHARDNDPEPKELAKILRKLEVGLDSFEAETAEAPATKAADASGEATTTAQ